MSAAAALTVGARVVVARGDGFEAAVRGMRGVVVEPMTPTGRARIALEVLDDADAPANALVRPESLDIEQA